MLVISVLAVTLCGVQLPGISSSEIAGGDFTSSFVSCSSAVLIIAFASSNWLASLQTVRPSVTRLAVILEPWTLHTT